MADYGVLLANISGEVWVSPSSIPLALFAKRAGSLPSAQGGTLTISVNYDSTKPIIPFVYTTGECAISWSAAGGICSVTFSRSASGNYEIYFFTIFQQIAPAYGIAIWDAAGKCILTNETKTLADMNKLGDPNSATASGIYINQVLSGKWGCVPDSFGAVTGIINTGGQPRPFASEYKALAKGEGANTRCYAYPILGTANSGVGDIVYHNLRNQMMVTRLDVYD